ncbi:ABC protein [Mycena venus]|uniref:ABC protein n=1 Tax=Mycena venus TaxID=2733690 RepID=A0A8H6XX12_9AGAR|nr:ABC protein [Mycena venus]
MSGIHCYLVAIKVVGATCQPMGPILVKAVIDFAKARAVARETGGDVPSIKKGFGMAFGLIGVVLLANVSQHQFFHKSIVTGVAARVALTACIYKRGVRLTGKERVTLTNSKILDFISTDVSRIDACSQPWTAPLQVTICLIILLTQLGPSALAGFSLIVFIFPIQERIIARHFKTRGKSMKFTDLRAKVLLVVLSSIRVVKYFCYEMPFLKRIYDIHDNEVRGIARSNTRSLLTSPWRSPSLFLHPRSHFLFQLLRQPMMCFPRSLSNIADARNALGRLKMRPSDLHFPHGLVYQCFIHGHSEDQYAIYYLRQCLTSIRS